MTGIGIIHVVQGEINHMQKIYQWSSARHFLVCKPSAKAWNAGPANPLGLRRIDLTHIASFYVFSQSVRFRSGPVVKIEH